MSARTSGPRNDRQVRSGTDPDGYEPYQLIPDSQRPRKDAPEVHVPTAQQRTLVVRVISGAIYAALNLLALFLSPVSTAILMSLTSGITCWEFYRLMRADAKQPNQFIGIFFAGVLPLVALTNPVYLVGVVFLLLLVVGFWYVIDQRARITDISVTVFGVLYTGLMLSTVVLMRTSELPGMGAMILTIGVVLSVWVNDALAYLVGSRFGRHKLVPKISPKKSWEGLFGGIIGSVLTWAAMIFFPETGVTWQIALVAGFVCGITGVVGDLIESRIKRGAGVKDSGNILPGHGGLLDRSDSLIFVSVCAYFVLRMMGAF